MKYLFLIILMLFYANFNINSQEQSFHISAQVINSEDSTPVSFAHVIIKNVKKGLMCNESGEFSCNTPLNDTLIITAIGFDTKIIDINYLHEQIQDGIIKLTPLIYAIDEVVIVPYKNYKEFKEAFLALEIPEKPFINLNIPNIKTNLLPKKEEDIIMIPIGSPITALYNAFSKEGKEIAEYNKLMKRKAIEKKVQKKYNINIVALLTGIQNEREVLDFMEFCNFSDEFILSSNDYEIYLAINNCYENYKKLNPV